MTGCFKVLWHGGECSLAGCSFFEEAAKLQKTGTLNSVQTNGFCSEEMLKTWHGLGFSVSSSVDLPLSVNAITRHEHPKAASRRLKRIAKYFPKHGVVSVVSRYNVEQPWRMLPLGQRLHWKANPVFFGASLAPKSADYTRFLKWWISRGLSDPKCSDVDPFAEFVRHVLIGKAVSCNFGRNCQENFIAVDPQGDFYPCSRFMGVRRFCLGNIEQGLQSALNSSIRAEFAARAEVLSKSECKDCEWFHVCYGGCPAENGLDKRDSYCDCYREAREHARRVLAENGVSFDDQSGSVEVPIKAFKQLPGLRAMLVEPGAFAGANFGSNSCHTEYHEYQESKAPHDDHSDHSESYTQHTDANPHTDYGGHTDEFHWDGKENLTCLDKSRVRALFQPAIVRPESVLLQRTNVNNDFEPKRHSREWHTDESEHSEHTETR